MPEVPSLQGCAVRPVDDRDGVLALAAGERTPDALGGAGAAGVDGELLVAALDEVVGASGQTAGAAPTTDLL